jgi:hypothetical protein
MSLCNAIASEIQIKLFDDLEKLSFWLKELKDVRILDIKFRSMIIIDEVVIRDRFLVIYK